jgi:hypothetical protein
MAKLATTAKKNENFCRCFRTRSAVDLSAIRAGIVE